MLIESCRAALSGASQSDGPVRVLYLAAARAQLAALSAVVASLAISVDAEEAELVRRSRGATS
jgi:hypothetical protein